ncbi:MAG: acetate kinase [bacterium]|nr:acetate kinase [bacterium]
MKVLVLNSGSSSLKYQVFDMENQSVLGNGLVERIGIPGGKITHKTPNGDKIPFEQTLENHEVALHKVLDILVAPEYGVLSSLSEVQAVGHRVVHGGEKFKASALVTPEVKEELKKLIALAPLHNPANIMGIEACEKILPGVANVAVFDTAFHQSMEPAHFLYALPYAWYEKYQVRRYGFHGTSHKYVSERMAAILGKSELKLITCHVGNGASIAAIKNGKVIETSMGFTPLEGLMMGTRCGTIDPAIIPFMMKKENLTADEIDTVMNKQSGVLGVSGISSDHRDIETGFAEGKEKETLVMQMYTNTILKYIGSYAALLEGIDAIVFTAGVLENSVLQRKLIAEKLGWLGVKFDAGLNDFRGKEQAITSEDSPVPLWVIPTNEELMIAKDTYALVA